MILPVIINGEPNVDGGRISAHIVASAHGRQNAWKGLVKEAIEVEEKGGIGIFFVDKAKASKVFTSLAQANPQLASAGLKYAKKPQGNGVLHSIHDPGSPVKAQSAKISSQLPLVDCGSKRTRLGVVTSAMRSRQRRVKQREGE